MKKRLDIILIILLFIGCLGLMFGCKTRTVTQYIPVESVRTEYKDLIQRDSVYVQDSIYINRFMKGDTIFVTKEKYKYLYHDKFVHDSVFVTDSIQVPYPVKGDTVYINRLFWWQKVLIWTGLITFLLFIVLVVYKLK